MNPTTYIDDDVIDPTSNIEHSEIGAAANNDNRDDDRDDATDDDSNPPASGIMMLAEPPARSSSLSALSYAGDGVFTLLSWLGMGLYSLTNIFGSSTSPEEQHMHILSTIAKLNNHLIFLDKKIESMNRNSMRFSEKAKYFYQSKKMPSAIHQIRLKKMYDCEIAKLEKLKFNIETNILHMDSVEIMMVTVDTIKDTSEHFKKINSSLNIEKLEDTIDELVEHRDSATDIQSVLSDMQLFNDADYDEEDLMKELEQMSTSDSNNTVNETVTPTKEAQPLSLEDLPEAPHTILPVGDEKNINVQNNGLELSAVF